ncbi:acylneuraminate cytidylyltransferase family protein [Methylomonas fluvii]|uniref:Acylneuraminate cytidylyltransferase family protein n=1 Tax=Methylomonas fluvii TaxID=1854564 RepID=A0ABR9DG23_9GAMM|nr:acylneuraminate cytidylyltransferase family protein [Methylomonas fluvii]MBD9362041.1 acylneuraminate cytidylyltransferase family protein [Methylomonas fluvii]CAD6875081.1 N-Acetylneuraminate cytidylyltransferase (EC 2.7.7.43) [Methylomonas fluvii]
MKANGVVDTVFQTLLIVPARSGSKGVADKNIKILVGKPLLQWTTDAIARAGLANVLPLLSTDSPAYGELGLKLGLTVPFLRPADCAGDTATALQVIQHALQWFCGEHGYLPQQTMWLQPTSPFRSPTIIHQAIAILKSESADAVIGCKEIHRNLTTLFRCDEGFLSPLDKIKSTQAARQQSQPLLTPNGAMYLCKTDYLLEHKSFYPPKTVPLVMNAIQSLDIDTEEDWAIAEAYIKQGLV